MGKIDWEAIDREAINYVVNSKWESGYSYPIANRVIINPPATIVFWVDGSKTVCKTSEGDTYDAEKGIMMCFMKKMLGNPSRVRKFFSKWIPEQKTEPKKERNVIYADGMEYITIELSKAESRNDVYLDYRPDVTKLTWGEIAQKLGISEATVIKYRRELDIASKTETYKVLKSLIDDGTIKSRKRSKK